MTRGGIRTNSLMTLLFAAALVLRVLVPQGFMPERSDAGVLVLKVCGEGGAINIPLGKHEPAKDERSASHCAFAGIGAPADVPPALTLPSRDWSGHQFAAHHAAAQRAAALYPRPPSRGPPLYA